MTLEATTTYDREQLLDEVVTAYLKEVQAGHTPEPQAWLARYPELAAGGNRDIQGSFRRKTTLNVPVIPLLKVTA